MKKRCDWATTDLSVAYHDLEWGVPQHDDGLLFEFLVLEGAQAGLSWETILKKRESYRKAFDKFDPLKVSRYNKKRIETLLSNPGIIRNRLKVESAISNAQAFIAVQEEFGRFDKYLWRFVNGRPIKRKPKEKIQAASPISDALSKDLSKRGFRFVGSTICYAFMQAVGLVNDHQSTCFRYNEVGKK